MASYKGHSAGGVAAVAVFLGCLHHFFSFQLDWVDILIFLVTGLLGAFFPDVDTNSRGQDIFYSLFFVLDFSLIALRKFEYAALLGLLVILPVLGKHRGWTHTWWAMLIVPFPIILLPVAFFKADPVPLIPYYLCAVSGYFSHLILDWKFK